MIANVSGDWEGVLGGCNVISHVLVFSGWLLGRCCFDCYACSG